MAWRDVTILRVVQETPCDRTFVLAPEAPLAPPEAFVPGQYVRLRDPAVRSDRAWAFSLSGVPEADGALRVTVRGRGPAVRHLYEAAAGTRWEATPPEGDFRVQALPGEVLVLVGAGSGVTPFRACLELRRRAGAQAPAWLLQSSRRAGELLFREEFEIWAREDASLHYVPTVTGADGAWSGRRGRLDAEALAPALGAPERVRVHACGPAAFVEHVHAAARRLGVAEERCLRESW
jgi:ferredoxin-NADP reductase